jgi:hypothetical protein
MGRQWKKQHFKSFLVKIRPFLEWLDEAEVDKEGTEV